MAVDIAVEEHVRPALASMLIRAVRFLALYASAVTFLAVWLILTWFGLDGLAGGAKTAAALLVIPALALGFLQGRTLHGSVLWADLGVAVSAAMIFVFAETLPSMEWTVFFPTALAIAFTTHCFAKKWCGLVAPLLIAVALLAAMSGASWQLAFSMNRDCLETRAEAATVGVNRSGRCATFGYNSLMVTNDAGQRVSWFGGNAPQHPGTFDWGIKRGVAYAASEPVDCPPEAIGPVCTFEPLGDGWFEYTYSTFILS